MNGKLKTAAKLLKENRSDIPYAVFRNITKLRWARIIPDEMYLKTAYKLATGHTLHLENPQTFNEKLQWLKLYDRRPEYVTMVDKYRVREYIAETIGEEYLIPLLGVWEKASDIDFDALPDQFVLKCNHDSGSVIICKDKSKLDKRNTIRKLDRALGNSGYWFGREWPYKNVKPCVIAEKYMTDPSLDELRDYKFFCFNGEVKCFKVDFDRFTDHGANYYDREKNILPFGEECCPPRYDKKISFPSTVDKMIPLAERMSKGISFLRVDFYSVDGKIYFGELTFYPASGLGRFAPDEWDRVLGDWVCLPDKKVHY